MVIGVAVTAHADYPLDSKVCDFSHNGPVLPNKDVLCRTQLESMRPTSAEWVRDNCKKDNLGYAGNADCYQLYDLMTAKSYLAMGKYDYPMSPVSAGTVVANCFDAASDYSVRKPGPRYCDNIAVLDNRTIMCPEDNVWADVWGGCPKKLHLTPGDPSEHVCEPGEVGDCIRPPR